MQIADTDNFVYLGSMYNRSALANAFSFDSGVVWRVQDNLAIKIGHSYASFGEFEGVALRPRNHSLRLGVVHFFKRR